MRISCCHLCCLASLFAAGALSLALQQPPPSPSPPSPPPGDKAAVPPAKRHGDRKDEAVPAGVDPKWLDRIPREDRAALEPLVGFAPPDIPADVKWIGRAPLDWEQLRGKVVVIQSFTLANAPGRMWPTRLARAVKDFQPTDVIALALHTPEDADEAESFLQRKPAPPEVAVLIDASGEFCDALGIYKQPANLVIDRHGAVRYVGLNDNGLKQAVAALVVEPFDHTKRAARPDAAAKPRIDPKIAAEFPAPTGTVEYARDIRGQRAPNLFVKEWITAQPKLNDRVVVIDFWATWCKPCVEAIGHMNSLAQKFAGQATFIGLSDEKSYDFEIGMKKKNLKVETFQYALAIDPSAAMKSSVGIRAIPHCLVLSRDWIVRWQGHPEELSAQTLEKIIKADESLGGGPQGDAAGNAGRRRGWRS